MLRDFILDRVSAKQNLKAYLDLPKQEVTLTMVGAPEQTLPVGVFSLLCKRLQLAGSAIGGIRKIKRCWTFARTTGSITLLFNSDETASPSCPNLAGALHYSRVHVAALPELSAKAQAREALDAWE